jgi:hypothetical protein
VRDATASIVASTSATRRRAQSQQRVRTVAKWVAVGGSATARLIVPIGRPRSPPRANRRLQVIVDSTAESRCPAPRVCALSGNGGTL